MRYTLFIIPFPGALLPVADSDSIKELSPHLRIAMKAKTPGYVQDNERPEEPVVQWDFNP